MTDELAQLRQRAEMAEADAAVLRAAIQQLLAVNRHVLTRSDQETAIAAISADIHAIAILAADHPGASLLAVAEAARAFLRADPAVENLADLLVALRAAVEEWER